jgi:hypothetical protein
MTTTTTTTGIRARVRRAIGAAAVLAGVAAAAVSAPAEPAGAHESTLNWKFGSVTVGAGHAGIRVCSPGPVGVYLARYTTRTGSQRALAAPYAGGCNDLVDGDGIVRYRLCVVDLGCSGWKAA